ncbi:MAG: hypothetical protein ACOCXJ_00975 [Planctomycetota bacterium]
MLSTGGSMILAAGSLLALFNLLLAVWRGRTADNPWGSAGYEWRCASPPSEHNFPEGLAVEPDPYTYEREGDSRHG